MWFRSLRSAVFLLFHLRIFLFAPPLETFVPTFDT
ncbi:hypothetical protein N7495_003906 [Penicillium taxi]|nr:uncharacterized protein N7495_003906 [Penicillium taxi]KAJ5899162.1 hypothetical protein N7495_003906 [Penicillium taxi]